MVRDLRDAIQTLEEARRKRESAQSLRHAYVTANASGIGRIIALWGALKAAARRDRNTRPIPGPALPPEQKPPDVWGLELREAAQRQR